ncbi:MAG TPA: PQQ-binding-like beta-propeller repeat protein, partial [Dokdonella sp.]
MMAGLRAFSRFGILGLALGGTLAQAQIDVLTERYDGSRLGANLQETQLTTANVTASTFGKLWSYTVNGQVYAQPLYVRNVAIPGQGTHNVLYVVTMNDWVYAFDADSNVDTPLLSFDLTTEVPGSRANTILEILGYNDNIIGNVGIESTPHIDLATNTMYLVARTLETGGCNPPAPAPNPPNPTFCQRLHALDITTLEEKPNSPVILGGSVPGTSAGSSGGTLIF